MIRFTILFVLFFSLARAQEPKPDSLKRPKLVVGIIVDQMRYDFITRYWEKYSASGFKKLVNEGFLCKNVHYNYIPTYTGPGHASVYTGTTPIVNGVVSNNWYDRYTRKNIYCVDDTTEKGVGGFAKMSPRNLMTSTMGDELRLATDNQSKVIGIALKDRGAILPAGRKANAAYWFDDSLGYWATSTYYMKSLPEWVNDFNKKNLREQYLSKPWELSRRVYDYMESTADSNSYEEPFKTESKPVFPHNLPVIFKADKELLRKTPFGNTMTKEFAMAAIQGENLGSGSATDFLCISFSSTDYVGHQFGIDAIETEDTYLRLDKDLSELLAFLEKRIGKENLLVFLTADHGAAHNAAYLKAQKIEAGVIDGNKLGKRLETHLDSLYGKTKYIASFTSYAVYFNDSIFKSGKRKKKDVENATKNFLKGVEGISEVYSVDELSDNGDKSQRSMLKRGMNPHRAADIYFTMKLNWMDYDETGTTHGSGYDYDTHVPLLFWGGKIPQGSTAEYHSITDIAPTVCTYLNISLPGGSSVKAIKEIFGK